jgi:hypothetical protein
VAWSSGVCSDPVRFTSSISRTGPRCCLAGTQMHLDTEPGLRWQLQMTIAVVQ